MNMDGKTVLITGSSRGIGFATACAFLDLGAQVAINGRSEHSVNTAMEQLGNTGQLVAAAGDVGRVDNCRSVVSTAIAGLGQLDILVNSAGVAIDASIEDSDEALWDQTMDINLKGTFFCSRAALPALRHSAGNIINVASNSGLQGEKDMTVYCASKGGVVNLTRAMAIELAPSIRVNCVCPGYVDTDMVRRDFIEQMDDPVATEQEVLNYSPLKRMATAGEIASAIVYLASDDARFITGTALSIDGGCTAGIYDSSP